MHEEPPQQSHQLPKGQLKLAQKAKGDARKNQRNRPNTIELLQGLAETAQERERREREEAEAEADIIRAQKAE